MSEIKLKQKYNFILKPSRMVNWFIIRETEKTYVISKDANSKGTYNLSKKFITEIIEVKD